MQLNPLPPGHHDGTHTEVISVCSSMHWQPTPQSCLLGGLRLGRKDPQAGEQATQTLFCLRPAYMIIHATMMSRLFRGGRAWALGGDELTHTKKKQLLALELVCMWSCLQTCIRPHCSKLAFGNRKASVQSGQSKMRSDFSWESTWG